MHYTFYIVLYILSKLNFSNKDFEEKGRLEILKMLHKTGDRENNEERVLLWMAIGNSVESF